MEKINCNKHYVLGFILLLIPSASFANDYKKFTTEFLAPHKRWAFNFNFNHANNNYKYDNNGDKIHLSDYLSANLDTNTVPELMVFGADASLGSTSGELSYNSTHLAITGGYGLRDGLSAGFKVILGKTCSVANLNISGGNLGLNLAFDPTQPITPPNVPFLPASVVPAMDQSSLEQLLTDPRYGYSYSNVGGHCVYKPMAPTIGLGWRVLDRKFDSLVLTPAIKMGEWSDLHDPDVLFNPVVANGNNGFILRTNYYRDLRANLDLAVRFELVFHFESKREMRIPSSELSIAAKSSIEEVRRNLGDYAILDIELGYRFWNDQYRVFAAYYLKDKQADRYHSKLGTDTRYLEKDTRFRAQEYRVGVYWDGIPSWQRGSIPLPIIMELNYWETFDGKNALKFEYVEFKISTAF